VKRAWKHFEDPESESDPFEDDFPVTGYYTALFDALGWANALDNRLRRDLSGEWFTEIEGAESIPRIRWARNAVHHQWDEAVYLDEKADGLPPRQIYVYWHWADYLRGQAGQAGARVLRGAPRGPRCADHAHAVDARLRTSRFGDCRPGSLGRRLLRRSGRLDGGRNNEGTTVEPVTRLNPGAPPTR
jgi:hypothetical protein